jgi:hypothetical protein
MRVVCFIKDCKHKCEQSDECTREIVVLDKEGKCKNTHPKAERHVDDIY